MNNQNNKNIYNPKQTTVTSANNTIAVNGSGLITSAAPREWIDHKMYSININVVYQPKHCYE